MSLEHKQVPLKWARAAVAVAVALLVFKVIAAWLTGSRAVYSDAAESVVNVVASSVMLLAVQTASKPADEEHPFGHGKAELLAAAFEGALLLLAAAAIAWDATPALFAPTPIQNMGLGSLLVGLTAIINGWFGFALIRTGRRTGSPALAADGRHLLTDSVTTLGVLIAMGIVLFTELWWVDAAAACILAVWIGYTGTSMVSGASRGLLDTRTPEYTEQITKALEAPPIEGLLDPHDLRIVDATSNVVVLLHARAPWMWTLDRGRELRKQTAQRIAEVFDVPTEVHVQLEPCEAHCCPSCPQDPCERRAAAYRGHPSLDEGRVSAPHPPEDGEPFSGGEAEPRPSRG